MSEDCKEIMMVLCCDGIPGHYTYIQDCHCMDSDNKYSRVLRNMDGKYTPEDHKTQGNALLLQVAVLKEPHTVLAVHDYTGDSRPGSNATFLLKGCHNIYEMIYQVELQCPKLKDRIGKIKLVD